PRPYKKREVWLPLFAAGVQGFEPRLADPESAVLPLNDTPMRPARCIIPYLGTSCQPPGETFFSADCDRAASLQHRQAGQAKDPEARTDPIVTGALCGIQ